MTASTGQSLVESNERDLQDNLDKMLKSTAVTEHLVRDMMKQGDGPEFDAYNSPPIAGLDILREHVALAGMGMELHSQPGQGAQVTVYAPRVHPDVVHSQLFIRAMLQQTEAPDSERVTIAKRVLRNAGLSNQQIGIMERVATGQIYRNIAAAMQISESNVKYHIERIQRKLGLSARSGIIETAYEVGLVPDRRKGAKT